MLLVSRHENTPQSTASQLAVMIDQVIRESGIVPKDLKAVAVSAGPGSYTGLRIGVATAKGLCFGLGIPLISINSLDLLAAQVLSADQDGWLCPMFDARRMEVYTCLYNENGIPQTAIEAKVIDETSFAEELKHREILFFGSGADKCEGVIRNSNARFVKQIVPTAEKLGELAFRKFLSNEFEDVESYEPFYLKDFLVKKPKTLF
jgi:tRNA threonylcarbamoyladenosine biosynthesis protein TsaB